MKTTLTRIITSDGIELVGLLYEPEIKTEKILVHVHGMAGNFYENPFLDYLAKTLTDHNVAFFAFNNRGCESLKDLTKTANGKKKYIRIGNTHELFEECIFDIDAAITFASNHGFKNIHLSGHSLGSPKVGYYLSQTKDARVASVLFISPSDMIGLEKDDENYEINMAEAQKLLKVGKGRELLSKQIWDEYPLSAQTFLNFFGVDSKIGIFNFHDPKDQFEALGKIYQPIIVIAGRKDDILIIPVEAIMEKITKFAVSSKRVETKVLGDANHGYVGHEQDLATTVTEWIGQN